jgi:hypothetical protein
MWVWHTLTPDGKTIADFRKENAQALQGVCRALTILCQTWALFGRARITMDGSQCKAVKSKARHVTEKKWQTLLKHIHEKSEAYLKELDEQAPIEAATNPPTPPV